MCDLLLDTRSGSFPIGKGSTRLQWYDGTAVIDILPDVPRLTLASEAPRMYVHIVVLPQADSIRDRV